MGANEPLGIRTLDDGTVLAYITAAYEPCEEKDATLVRVINPDGSVELLIPEKEEPK